MTTGSENNAWVGRSVPRKEDFRLLTGQGRFTDDELIGIGELHAVFVRSPHAHAKIGPIDLDAAREMPGVVAIYTGTDLQEAGLKDLPCATPVDSSDGTPFHAPRRPPLAVDTVRFVGDPVAMVLAETPEQAVDAAELVDIDYDELDVEADLATASDIAMRYEVGDKAAVDAAFASAARTVSISAVNNRIVVSPLEPRSALALPEEDGRLTLYSQSQGVHFLRDMLAKTLDIPPAQLDVITRDVGGSFGMKLVNFPEQTCILHAARDLSRPVRWISTRSEAFLTDAHARDHVSHAEAAFDGDGKLLGLRISTRGNLGAYASALGPMIVSQGFAKTAGHVYRVPVMHLVAEGVYTHTAPTDAYRGAGKPESVYLVERLMEKAARELDIDRIELRARNLVQPEDMPYQAANGFKYDSGDFPGVMQKALELADWEGFSKRRAESEARGMKRGIGLGLYLHLTGGDAAETSEVIAKANGTVEVRTGIQSSGQGHETAFAQLVAQRLGLSVEAVNIVEGDTRTLRHGGGGTGGSSSLPIAGVTIARATEIMIDQGREKAAEMLETAPADIEFRDAGFHVVGTDKSVGLFDVAARMEEREGYEGCAGMAQFDGEKMTVPNGAYVCEVEVDPETGMVEILDFLAVDDIGNRLNPMIADGQIVGGIAQGIGQALTERTVYEEYSGQLLTGSFMDYGLPRADDLPEIRLVDAGRPTAINPLGMKGAGEIGNIGAPAAVINAIADAIGTDVIDMPATPEAVWQALQSR